MTYQRRTARRSLRARIAAATCGPACTTAAPRAAAAASASVLAEALESRRLLSASISGRVLVITGTDAGDFVTFGFSSGDRLQVNVGGVNQGRFKFTDFDRIQANLLGGADVLQAVALKPLTMDGGAGDDASGNPDRIEITATSASETITASARRVTVGAQTYDFLNTENVFVNGAGGNDTFRLVAVPAGVPATPTPWMSFRGNTGNDTFDAPIDVPWTGGLYFDGGAGTDRLIAGAATHYDYWAGDGADTLVLPTSNESDWTTIDLGHATVHRADNVAEIRGVNHNAIERIEVLAGPSGAPTGATHVVDISNVPATLAIHVAGSADADQVNVNTSPFGLTNASLTFNGNGGEDRLLTQPGVNVFATYDGGAGADALVFGGETNDDVLTADGDSVADDRGVVNYTNVSQVEVRADAGNDLINVSASATVGFHVRGHSTGTSLPDASDRLHVDRAGGTPTGIVFNPGSTTDGQVNFADRLPITFSGIRDVTGLDDMKPTAHAGGPYQVPEGLSIPLDPSGSRPFEGAIVKYEWDLDYDGVTFHANVEAISPPFNAVGLRAPLVRGVAVRVTDAGGRTAIASTTVTVTPTQPPVANPGGPYEVYRNGWVAVTSAASSDVDGEVVLSEWDLDYDGVTFDVDSNADTFQFMATGLPAGTVRTLGLRVVDNIGVRSEIATTTVTVKLSDPPTANAGGPYTTNEFGSLQLNATATPGQGDAVSRIEWDFDYDGVTFHVERQQATFGTTFHSHQWDGPSTRNAAARVVTTQGQTAVATTTVQVNNVAPLPTISNAATAADEGAVYSIQLNRGFDPNGISDLPVSWRVDWGDGVIETLPGGTTSTLHRYPDGPAEHGIRAWFTDDDGTYEATKAFAVDTAGFGSGVGYVTTNLGTGEGVRHILQLPDKKLMAIGTTSFAVELFRYNANGTADTSLNFGGSRSAMFSGAVTVTDAVLQPDGKFLVAGSTPATSTSAPSVTLLRFNADGTLDPTFATGGVFRREFAGQPTSEARDVELMPDGRIVIGAVAAAEWSPGNFRPSFTLLRLNPDGSPDATFGTGGVANAPLSPLNQPSANATLAAIRVLADGSVVAVGTHQRFNPFGLPTEGAVARYSPTGALLDVQYRTLPGNFGSAVAAAAFASDDSFVLGGSLNRAARYSVSDPAVAVTITLGQGETLAEVLPQADGSVLVASRLGTSMALARFKPDGTRDTSFGLGGSVQIAASVSQVYTATQTPAGAILIGGSSSGNAGDFAVGRIVPAGTVYVRNVVPTATVTPPASASAGTPVEVQLAVTDPGADTINRWTIDWGDGVVETVTGNPGTASHTYPYGGPMVVRASAFDEDGGPYNAANVTIDVAPQPPALGDDGVLRIWTGDAVDTLDLSAPLGAPVLRLVLNGTTYEYDYSAVTAIDVRTFGAADVVTLGPGVPTGSIDLGGKAGPDTLNVTGLPAGAAPLAVTSFSSTINFPVGMKANLTLSTAASTTVNLSGTEAADAWVLHNNDIAGAGNALTWNAGVVAFNINALGGDDTFESTTDGLANARRPSYRLNGGDGNDTVRLLGGLVTTAGSSAVTPGLFLFNGGEGDDTFEAAGTTALLGTAGFTGENGNDLLIFNGRDDAADFITASNLTVRRSDNGGSVNSFSVSGQRQIAPFGWDEMRVYGHGGNDTLSTSSGAAGVAVMPLKTLLDGGAGDDQFRLGNDANMPTTSPVDLRGGEGADSVQVNDFNVTAGTQPRSYALDATGVQRDALPRHTFDTIEAVTLNTSSLIDAITVTPAASTAFTINAGSPTTTPGDKLRLNLAGATGATHTAGTAAGSGTYTFADRQPVNYAGIEDAHEFVAPRVATMFVGSTAWTTAYRASLSGIHPGSEAAYGYRILSSDHRKTLPWSNLNQVSVRFTEHVNVAADDFVLNGVNLAHYGLSTTATAFAYDPVTFTATWTLAQFIPNDKVTVRLDAAEGTGVTDNSGNRLDGEPNNAVTHLALFPSGDGVAGGDFAMALRVLPGDLDRSGIVNVFDYNLLRANLNQPNKSAFGGDINGDGVVSMLDANALLANLNKTVPV